MARLRPTKSRYPLVVICLAFISGILLADRFSFNPTALTIATVVLFISAIFLHLFRFRVEILFVLLTVVALGVVRHAVSQLSFETLYARLENLRTITGTVIDYPAHGGGRSRFILKPEGEPGAVQIFYDHGPQDYLSVGYGDRLRLSGTSEVPWTSDAFDYRAYLRHRGIWGIVRVREMDEIERLGTGGHPVLRWGYQTRETLFGVIDRYVSNPEAGLLKAILFGERAYLDREIETSFQRTGLAHILAVSGLHLGIIIGILWWGLKRLRWSEARIYLILLPIVLIYLIIVGFRVSLVRATVLFGFMGLGWVLAELGLILKRWRNLYQALAAAALILLMVNPGALFDVGFQLSFAATLAIIACTPTFEAILQRLGVQFFRSLLAVSIAAQLGVAPIIAYHFHQVYLVIILANLIVIPLTAVALFGGIGVLVFGSLGVPGIAPAIGLLESWALKALAGAAGLFAGLPFAYFDLTCLCI
ncbi:MAG: ComEC/Rec2 family competence protein [Candidatus Bipolaricaulia bacterium]